WDAQFYPEGIDGWFVKLDAGTDGSLTVDPNVFVPYSGERPHQVRLSGGDAPSDSYCFPAQGSERRPGNRAAGPAGGLPRAQAGDGLAVRGRAGDAGALAARRAALARADRHRARALDRAGGRARARPRSAGRLDGAARGRRDLADRVRDLPV